MLYKTTDNIIGLCFQECSSNISIYQYNCCIVYSVLFLNVKLSFVHCARSCDLSKTTDWQVTWLSIVFWNGRWFNQKNVLHSTNWFPQIFRWCFDFDLPLVKYVLICSVCVLNLIKFALSRILFCSSFIWCLFLQILKSSFVDWNDILLLLTFVVIACLVNLVPNQIIYNNDNDIFNFGRLYFTACVKLLTIQLQLVVVVLHFCYCKCICHTYCWAVHAIVKGVKFQIYETDFIVVIFLSTSFYKQ